MRTKSPLLVAGTSDPSGLAAHPFAGLPAEVMAGLYTLPATESLPGLGGMLWYFNHFLKWEGPFTETQTNNWTLYGVTGTATISMGNSRNGDIAINADSTSGCNPTLILGNSSGPSQFIYSAGKRLWAFARLKMATVASTEFFFGFGTADQQPTVTNTFPSNGLFFNKAASDTNLTLDVRKSGTSTSNASVLANALADDTYVTIGIRVNERGDIIPYENGTARTAAAVAAGNANIPTAAMSFMVGFLGASQIVTLDWLLLAQEI